MGKTGFILKVITRLEGNWESHSLAYATKEMQVYNEGLHNLNELLKKARASKNIDLLLNVEQAMLHQENVSYANSAEERNSIETALMQISEAKDSLAVVRDPQAYQAATATYSGKRKEAGLPIDSFREFLKSHSTRLSNRMAAQLSVPEKNVMRQRKENLSTIKEIYMGMQRQALGLARQDKEKALGR